VTNYYTKESAKAVIVRLVELSKLRVTDDIFAPEIREFIQEHPWSQKWLSAWTEADWLMEICIDPTCEVAEYPWPANLQKYRDDRGMPEQVRFSVFGKDVKHAFGNRKVFTFERRPDGYVFK
jgi:hypothetical protein